MTVDDVRVQVSASPLPDEVVAARERTIQLERQLAQSRAELSELRRVANEARDAAVAAQNLNVELLAEAERREPADRDLLARSLELDAVYATRTWRWTRAPRQVWGAVRRRAGRRAAGISG